MSRLLTATFIILTSSQLFGQRQYQLKQMRDLMEEKLAVYSFGYSWDNQDAYSELNAVLSQNQSLVGKTLLWKNTPNNLTERNFYRLLSNFGLASIESSEVQQPLIEALLSYDPYLIPDESDNEPDLSHQLREFFPLPSFKVGFHLGINYYNPRAIQENQIVRNITTTKSYSPEIGWNFGVRLSYLLAKNFGIGVEPGLGFTSFNVKEEFLDTEGNFNYQIFNLHVPIVGRLALLNPKLSGFANIGSYYESKINTLDSRIGRKEEKLESVSARKATKLERKLSRERQSREHLEMIAPYRQLIPYLLAGVNPKLVFNSSINALDAGNLVNQYQVDLVTGIGVERMGVNTTFQIEFRYNLGLLDLNNEEIFSISGETGSILFEDYYVSDQFRVNSFEISISLNYILNSKAFRIR